MLLIRIFLWTLVGALTLQGYLHADEYGSKASMIGGMSLTLSIWKESLEESARSIFWTTPAYVALPRLLVQAALKETVNHPNLHMIPSLQKTIKIHRQNWDNLREEDVKWMLDHADLIGGILSDPDGVAIWADWSLHLNISETALKAATAGLCNLAVMNPIVCEQRRVAVEGAQANLSSIKAAVSAWNRVLGLRRGTTTDDWWGAVHPLNRPNRFVFDLFYTELARLHDIESPRDPRLQLIRTIIAETTDAVMTANESAWMQHLVKSLMTGEMWQACLDHVRLRESRVRELMVAAGVEELYSSHERILNASLRVVSSAAEIKTVQDWFGEMSVYAWWLSDDFPSLVRRCIGQEAGVCTRIGPTEVIALSDQFVEKSRIVEDWVRRIFIGMWNAIPVVGLLFVMELVLICISKGTQAQNQVSNKVQDQNALFLEYILKNKDQVKHKNKSRLQKYLLTN